MHVKQHFIMFLLLPTLSLHNHTHTMQFAESFTNDHLEQAIYNRDPQKVKTILEQRTTLLTAAEHQYFNNKVRVAQAYVSNYDEILNQTYNWCRVISHVSVPNHIILWLMTRLIVVCTKNASKEKKPNTTLLKKIVNAFALFNGALITLYITSFLAYSYHLHSSEAISSIHTLLRQHTT